MRTTGDAWVGVIAGLNLAPAYQGCRRSVNSSSTVAPKNPDDGKSADVLFQDDTTPPPTNDVLMVAVSKVVKGTKRERFDREMVEEMGEQVRPQLEELFATGTQRLELLRGLKPEEYFNFGRVQISDAEKTALRAQVIQTIVATGRVPKEKTTFEEIRQEARQMHPDLLKNLTAFQKEQAPYRAVRQAARTRINLLNRRIVEARQKLVGLPAEDVVYESATSTRWRATYGGCSTPGCGCGQRTGATWPCTA